MIADPPEVTTHPQDLTIAKPGQTPIFTVEATGTEPLSYHWEWNPAGREDGREVWQSCDVEMFLGSDDAKLIIPSVQKSNEGSYHCVVSNCAGTQISKPAKLSVGKNEEFWCTGIDCKKQQTHILYHTLLHVDVPLKPAGECGKW